MLHSWANPDGTQKIENTGPLTIKRMETVDEEFLDASLKFMDKAVKDDKPFFCWWNSTRMHIFTHLKKESRGRPGWASIPTAWWSTTVTSGELLDKLDRARHRRQHHRDVLDGQRRRGDELAGRRDDAVPRREGHEL